MGRVLVGGAVQAERAMSHLSGGEPAGNGPDSNKQEIIMQTHLLGVEGEDLPNHPGMKKLGGAGPCGGPW